MAEIIENVTAARDYPLPHPLNNTNVDVVRLIAALEAIDADIAALVAAVAQKAELLHQHEFGDIPGLTEALAEKAAGDHSHALDDLSDVSVAGATNGQFLKRVGTAWNPATVQIGDVPGLQDALDNPSSHHHDDRYYTINETDILLGGKSSNDHHHDASYAPLSREVATSGLASGGGDLSENRTIDVPKATGSDFRAGADDSKALTTKTAYDSVAEIPLTYADPLEIDFSTGTNFAVTLQGSPTISVTGLEHVVGKTGRIRFIQDATGNREPSWGDGIVFSGSAPTFSSEPGTEDIAWYDVLADDRVFVALTPEIG